VALGWLWRKSMPVRAGPFAVDKESLCVVLSDIAVHGLNLKARPAASVLIIEDEDTATELFARKRLAYHVTAQAPRPGNIDWEKAVDALEHAHGNSQSSRIFKFSA
tara:strand:- start:725 stop:1042 length:318 start_codon:yes stop_codon:yes gene_type:complete